MGAVVTLVPWRPGEYRRERWWEYVRPHLESLDYELFTGDAPDEWARAAACNAAAVAAGDWEVALIADADTVLDPLAVRRAVKRVRHTRAAARPHDHRYMLSIAGSKLMLKDGRVKPQYLWSDAPGGGATVVHREAWDAVGGYDERFVGWGYEDSAMNIALLTTKGWERMPGVSYHLHHLQPNYLSGMARANYAILDEYRGSKARQIDAESRKAGYDLNTVL